MGSEGIAAIQARVAQIQQMIGATTIAPAAPSAKTANLAAELTATGLGAGGADPADFSSLLQGALGTQSGSATSAAGTTAKAQEFLGIALKQKGKPYVYGAHTQPTDVDPPAFDCSELTKWAAAQSGITIPDGATAQYLKIRDQGRTMSVEEALRTPGALLFHFGHEPKDLGDIPADGHVAISVGDGVHTIEARGRKYGTGIFEATGNRAGFFNRAGMIAGM
jgi:cell wall-associated NlpC family hydrolase